jgi:hypothetical protein
MLGELKESHDGGFEG